MEKFRLSILALIVTIGLAACNQYTPKDASPNDGLNSNDGQALSYAYVKAQVFQPYCISCHSAVGGNPNGVNLETYANTIQNISKIQTEALTDGSMPPSNPIPTFAQTILKNWIAAGAPEEAPVSGPAATATPTPTPSPGTLQPTWQSLYTNIFQVRCITCHSGSKPPAGIDFTNQAWIINPANNVVIPGNPTQSRLYEAVTGTGTGITQMPPSGSLLTSAQISAIKTWIQNGATP